MKKIQKIRLTIQLLAMILVTYSFFTKFRITSLIIFISTIFFGAYYCGWLCPFGTIQELFSKIGTYFNIKKLKMPKVIQKYLIFCRYFILLIFLTIGTDIVFSLISLDPRINFTLILQKTSINLASILVLFSFMLISIFFERPFCNYLCIEGAKYGLASFFRIFTIKRNKDKCIDCNKCDLSCPMEINISKKEYLNTTHCINCFKCQSICPISNTITYEKNIIDYKFKIKYFLLISSLLIGSILYIYNDSLNFSKADTIKESTISENITSTTQNNILEKSIIEEKSNTNFADLDDGIYIGKSEGFKSTIVVEVLIQNKKIISVNVVEQHDDKRWFDRANNSIPQSIVDNQSTSVNTVSGATYSSLGIINAVKDALEQ